MKYYDTYLPYIIDDDYDWSYPAPEMQLLWRLDDLQDRLLVRFVVWRNMIRYELNLKVP